MLNFKKIFVVSLGLWIPLSPAQAADIEVWATTINQYTCALAQVGEEVGAVNFSLTYDNTRPNTPRVFKLEVSVLGKSLENPRVEIPSVFPIYKDGILDLSQFESGSLSGLVHLTAKDGCVESQPIQTSDVRLVLTPIR